MSGLAAASDENESSEPVVKSAIGSDGTLESGWWENDDDDRALIAEGTTDWISTDEEAPEWLTIHEDDELRYKPHGKFQTKDAKLCLPTSVDVGPVTVGIEACHYGGCEWKVDVCLAACIGTGRNEDCESKYTIGGDVGAVDAGLTANPQSDGSSIVSSIDVSGELCYYYVVDSDCKNVDHTFNF